MLVSAILEFKSQVFMSYLVLFKVLVTIFSIFSFNLFSDFLSQFSYFIFKYLLCYLSVAKGMENK